MASPTRPVAILAALALGLAGCVGSDDEGGSEGGGSGGGNERLFSASGFGEALDAAGESSGDDAQVISIEVTDRGAEFFLLSDGEASALVYANGELADSELDVVGGAPEGAGGFQLSEVDPGAVDAMVAGVAQANSAGGLEIVAMSLEPDESGEPRWTITATAGGGESLTYRAAADGSDLVAADDATRGQGGSGGEAVEPVAPDPAQPIPGAPGAPSDADVQAALECVQAAEGDVEQLQECAKLVQP